jgi:GNAT superfamily N-acetyltransferase
MRIREIEDLGPIDARKARSLDYKDPTKDKKDPDYIDTSDQQILSKAKPIPGSNLRYSYIESSWVYSSLYIINENDEVIGAADLMERAMVPDSVYVSRITTEPEYRNQGVAKALYHTLLFVLNKPILSGSSQTQGGQRNWASIAKMPGVVVRGYMEMNAGHMEKYKDQLADMGAEVHPEWSRDWNSILTFPVTSEGPRMRTAQGSVPLYTQRGQKDFERGMIAYVPKAKPITVAAVVQAAEQEKVTFMSKLKKLFGLGK